MTIDQRPVLPPPLVGEVDVGSREAGLPMDRVDDRSDPSFGQWPLDSPGEPRTVGPPSRPPEVGNEGVHRGPPRPPLGIGLPLPPAAEHHVESSQPSVDRATSGVDGTAWSAAAGLDGRPLEGPRRAPVGPIVGWPIERRIGGRQSDDEAIDPDSAATSIAPSLDAMSVPSLDRSIAMTGPPPATAPPTPPAIEVGQWGPMVDRTASETPVVPESAPKDDRGRQERELERSLRHQLLLERERRGLGWP